MTISKYQVIVLLVVLRVTVQTVVVLGLAVPLLFFRWCHGPLGIVLRLVAVDDTVSKVMRAVKIGVFDFTVVNPVVAELITSFKWNHQSLKYNC
jgi:hypothetical protein